MENQNLENENGKCFAAIPISEAFEKDADVFQCLNCETETEIARDEDLIKKVFTLFLRFYSFLESTNIAFVSWSFISIKKMY